MQHDVQGDDSRPLEAEQGSVSDTGHAGVGVDTLEETIQTHQQRIDESVRKVREYTAMLEDVLINDDVYSKHEETAKEAVRVRNATRAEIMKRPEVSDIVKKVKDLRVTVKDMRLSLSDYLREFQRLSGASEIETKSGETMEIVSTVRLIRKPTR